MSTNQTNPVNLSSNGESRTSRLVKIAFLVGISAILYMYFSFPLPFFPSFLKLQISDVGAIIGGLMYGPVVSVVIVVIKVLLKVVFDFGATMGVGEFCDIFLGIAFALPPSIIYLKFKTNKGLVFGLAIGVIASVLVAMAVNYLFIVPMYVKVVGGWDVLASMIAGLFPNVTKDTFYQYYIPFAVIPFNFLRGVICALVSFLVYKGLKGAMGKTYFK